jgi:hypothetical protein
MINILAWIIIALTLSFLFFPAIGVLYSNDIFIGYKDAFKLGHIIAFVVFALFVFFRAIIWALEKVVF